MAIEHDLQAVLNAAAPNTPWILIQGDLVRTAEAELTQMRADLDRLRREVDELRQTIPATAPGIRV